MNNKAAIFLNGNLSNAMNVFDYITPKDTIICADGGAVRALGLGILPHVVIGDFDSLPKNIQNDLKKKSVKLIFHHQEKDQTDAELVLDYALEKKFTEIIIFGLLGNQIDHLLANIFLLIQPKFCNKNITIIEGRQELFIISKRRRIKGKKNDRLSLIPLKDDVIGITTSGLYYALTSDTLYLGKSRGVSNLFSKKMVTVAVKKGILLAIHEKV